MPRGAHPLDFSALIAAAGRWNRRGMYGCLYTARTPAGAAAEYRKHFVRRGLARPRDLVCLELKVERVFDLVGLIAGDTELTASEDTADTVGRQPLLPSIEINRLTGDEEADVEHCRSIADWARRNGYLAIHAPSAAMKGERTLAVYPENRPDELRIQVHSPPVPLNYGEDPFIDAAGPPRPPGA